MTKTCDQGSDNRIAVNSYQHCTNYYNWKIQAKLTKMEKQDNQQFDLLNNNQPSNCNKRETEMHQSYF